MKNPTKADEEESEEEDSDDESEGMIDQVVETVVEAVVEPVKPLALLLPHRGKHGSLEWRLFILTMSLLATTSGVGHSGVVCSPQLTIRLYSSLRLHYYS